MAPSGSGPTESMGALLARVRLASGKSQLRVAELLCAASGTPTVTRHELSRWEREERIASGFWLGWLSLVLEVPVETLTAAAMVTRRDRSRRRLDPPDPDRAVPGTCPADRYPSSPNRGNVYVTWTAFRFTATGDFQQGPIFGSMSTDGGRHFSTPEDISASSDTLCFFGNFFDPTLSEHKCDFNQGSDPTVLPNGDLVVIFNNGNTPAGNPNGQQLGVVCHPTGNSANGTAHLNCTEPTKVGDDITYTLTVSNTIFNNNTATSNGGGGLYNNGALTLTNSTFTNNTTRSTSSSRRS